MGFRDYVVFKLTILGTPWDVIRTIMIRIPIVHDLFKCDDCDFTAGTTCDLCHSVGYCRNVLKKCVCGTLICGDCCLADHCILCGICVCGTCEKTCETCICWECGHIGHEKCKDSTDLFQLCGNCNHFL